MMGLLAWESTQLHESSGMTRTMKLVERLRPGQAEGGNFARHFLLWAGFVSGHDALQDGFLQRVVCVQNGIVVDFPQFEKESSPGGNQHTDKGFLGV